MTTPEHPETLLEFPCAYPIKAMGESSADFDAVVVEIPISWSGRICSNLPGSDLLIAKMNYGC